LPVDCAAAIDRHTPQPRCILILDEYELIDEKLSAATAKDFATLLRGLTQQYPWLAMALVGLHSLEERSASFYQAIYAWRPIRVGLMDTDAVAEVLQVEDDAFPLEYSLDAVARIHALTGGQPFLVQLLGDSLVQRFNQQLRQQLDPPSPTFSAADVDARAAYTFAAFGHRQAKILLDNKPFYRRWHHTRMALIKRHSNTPVVSNLQRSMLRGMHCSVMT